MTRLLPRSLAGQLVALILVVLVVVQLVTVALFSGDRRSAVEAAFREQLLERTASLVLLLDEAPTGMRRLILASAGSRQLRFDVDDTPAVAEASDRRVAAEMTETLRGLIGDGRTPRVTLADRDLRVPADGPPGGHLRTALRISVPLADGNWLNVASIAPPPPGLNWVTLVSTIASALGLVLVAVLSLRRIARPLAALADASTRFGRGDATGPLPETGPEELRRTTRAFNVMQERIGRFVADRTRMIAALSHDLRTPLTAMRLRAEFVDDAETRDKLIQGIDEMSHMAEAVLAFARDEATGDPARPTDLSALVAAVADDFTDLGQPVSVAAPDGLEAVVRPVALRRALRNLVENAVRYGGGAEVGLTATGDRIEITVADRGPGIPEDRLEEMFEPFVRLESSRSADTGGVGLGLSIARSALRAQGGDVTLENRPGGGLIARIALPA